MKYFISVILISAGLIFSFTDEDMNKISWALTGYEIQCESELVPDINQLPEHCDMNLVSDGWHSLELNYRMSFGSAMLKVNYLNGIPIDIVVIDRNNAIKIKVKQLDNGKWLIYK